MHGRAGGSTSRAAPDVVVVGVCAQRGGASAITGGCDARRERNTAHELGLCPGGRWRPFSIALGMSCRLDGRLADGGEQWAAPVVLCVAR